MDLLTRFESFFKKGWGCWVWTGSLNWAGYGQFQSKTFPKRAHRAAFELYVCDIPKGLKVLHTCDNPACVNPEHLWLGTQADNAEDREEKQRGNHKQGIKHGMAKLNEAKVKAIRKDKRTTQQIADDYNIHRGHVSDIKNYRIWMHIPKSLGDITGRGQGFRSHAK